MRIIKIFIVLLILPSALTIAMKENEDSDVYIKLISDDEINESMLMSLPAEIFKKIIDGVDDINVIKSLSLVSHAFYQMYSDTMRQNKKETIKSLYSDFHARWVTAALKALGQLEKIHRSTKREPLIEKKRMEKIIKELNKFSLSPLWVLSRGNTRLEHLMDLYDIDRKDVDQPIRATLPVSLRDPSILLISIGLTSWGAYCAYNADLSGCRERATLPDPLYLFDSCRRLCSEVHQIFQTSGFTDGADWEYFSWLDIKRNYLQHNISFYRDLYFPKNSCCHHMSGNSDLWDFPPFDAQKNIAIEEPIKLVNITGVPGNEYISTRYVDYGIQCYNYSKECVAEVCRSQFIGFNTLFAVLVSISGVILNIVIFCASAGF